MPPAPTPRTYHTEMQKETKACDIYLLQDTQQTNHKNT